MSRNAYGVNRKKETVSRLFLFLFFAASFAYERQSQSSPPVARTHAHTIQITHTHPSHWLSCHCFLFTLYVHPLRSVQTPYKLELATHKRARRERTVEGKWRCWVKDGWMVTSVRADGVFDWSRGAAGCGLCSRMQPVSAGHPLTMAVESRVPEARRHPGQPESPGLGV